MNKTTEQLLKEIETLTYERDSWRDVVSNLEVTLKRMTDTSYQFHQTSINLKKENERLNQIIEDLKSDIENLIFNNEKLENQLQTLGK